MAGSTANLLYVKGLAKHCGLPGVGCPGYQQLLLGSLKSLQARRCCLKGMSHYERCRWGQEPGHAILKACPEQSSEQAGVSAQMTSGAVIVLTCYHCKRGVKA